MTSPLFPNYVRGVSNAGVDALRAAAAEFADWQLRAPIDTTLDDAAALAADYLAKLEYPEHIFDRLPPEAQDRVAQAVGCPTLAEWAPPEPIDPDVPDYAQPSWEKDVYAVLFVREDPPPPAPRDTRPARPDAAAIWPELASFDSWRAATDRTGVTSAIARGLGSDWEVLPDAPDGFPRLRCVPVDVVFVVVPGGVLRMGLSDDDVRALRSQLDEIDEVDEVVEELTSVSGPVHDVIVDPFLCAVTPLLERHGDVLGIEGDPANAHCVLRVDDETAAAVVADRGFRLLSEAEWEWTARAGGAGPWIGGDEIPADWVRRQVSTEIESLAGPLGVVALGWGEWVDDGWHGSYEGAPERSTAWDPKVVPETSRGGALSLWPWQSGGEVLLCLAAFRERNAVGAAHAVRLAYDLPAR